MRIGELEKRTGVGRHALRYYEREGLIFGVRRSASNYREYAEEAVRQVELLRQMQSLGFSLSEIRQVLVAMRAGSIDCAAGARLMAEKRARIDKQIADLRKVGKLLAAEHKRLIESAAQQRGAGSVA